MDSGTAPNWRWAGMCGYGFMMMPMELAVMIFNKNARA